MGALLLRGYLSLVYDKFADNLQISTKIYIRKINLKKSTLRLLKLIDLSLSFLLTYRAEMG
jgi:hypothetical protein